MTSAVQYRPPDIQLPKRAPQPGLRWDTWRAWVLANLVAEALGLGATLLIGIMLFGGLESLIGAVLVALLAVALGAIVEGSIVGGLQWFVLRRPIPDLRWRAWAVATAAGAGIAWALGMVPSVAMSFVPAQGAQGTTQGFAMAESVVLLLALLMGGALGAILGVAQWVALRRHVPAAGWWVLANAVAWAVGMVLVFAGTSFIPESGVVTPASIIAVIAGVVLAGTTVGAVHGLVLIWLLRLRDQRLLAHQ